MRHRGETPRQRSRRLAGIQYLPDYLSDDERRVRLEAMRSNAMKEEKDAARGVAAVAQGSDSTALAVAREKHFLVRQRIEAIDEQLKTGGWKL